MSGSALFETFARAPLAFERGEGSWLITETGERYLDFAGGIAVNSLGHSHPHLVQALTEQAAKLWHVSNLYQIPGQSRLGERLAENSFADRVFFTNSGAEALECAIKTARRYQYVKGHPERYRVITFEGAFHGRTLATIAAGGQAKYLEGFGPKVEGFDQVAFDDIDAAEKLIGPETAAIMLEPVQGEGGIRPFPTASLKRLRQLCDKHGLLLIFDEVQCGIGRTGKLFAHEWAGVNPDLMAIAKGIGGGFPMGACLATEEAASAMTAGVHGTTFGGNPLAMAVGNAVLDVVLEEGFLDEVSRKALLIKQGLAAVADEFPDVIEGIRGSGLMLGLKCTMPNTKVNMALRDHKLLAVPAGDNVIRLLPPLTTSDADIQEALARVRAGAASLSKAAASGG
ncbi:aspartate aminotransferase family protein [Aminobacter sp. NyZ550]|jgi:acetylornithine/N-succinyldiaminopimelate aminotransferase|uniref:Acetylornithine aminotransferase n=2 Tax=Aminobacter TaxID=31988 RepID=A0AAC8YU24_AMIAI|nr:MULTISPECIES: aspartate aminotransferase family protein [Aminobacter]AMS44214.1 acetylornithine aminotransferase [Aminobacter aminovorans]MBA8910383.1 acetylornithine/N-succinyldiaminopimelate aminotransferase [Aminobacter ciceronei]MBA9024166.1 acetylornithine/N-succinyldiaminopimelate aminotransferase [Aminobacter ciceronei]MBB3709553.1 acetylornithine/N-succinyldiaminopimelate aminotransferase [Aminobacter aminovorans]MRX36987.1 acetylornithine/succinylornithine family transaminase [Amin